MTRILPAVLFFLLMAGCLWADENAADFRREALNQLSMKAEEGDAKAMYELARLLETGYDTLSADTSRSIALYIESAGKGYAPAQNYVGFRYYNGKGVTRDIDSALYWIRLAAHAGDITAAANLAYLLIDSNDVTHDSLEAVKWLYVASEGGVREAQVKLVAMMEKDWEKLSPDSALNLGLKYYSERAPIVGVRLIEVAADADNPKALALLGDAYSKGLGVIYDHQKSLDYFYRAARLGDPSAQFIIAELIEFFPDSIEETARYWYDKAASGGVEDSEEAYKTLFSQP